MNRFLETININSSEWRLHVFWFVLVHGIDNLHTHERLSMLNDTRQMYTFFQQDNTKPHSPHITTPWRQDKSLDAAKSQSLFFCSAQPHWYWQWSWWGQCFVGRTSKCHRPSHMQSSMPLQDHRRLAPAHIVCSSALVYLLSIFKRKYSFFFIFRLGKRKQEVPPELHHTLPAQSTALRSVFLHWWVPAGQLICFRYFPMVNEGNTKALSWPGKTTRLEYINLHTCPFWKMKFMAAHKKLYSCPYVLNKASCTSRVSLRQPDLMERGILGKGMA